MKWSSAHAEWAAARGTENHSIKVAEKTPTQVNHWLAARATKHRREVFERKVAEEAGGDPEKIAAAALANVKAAIAAANKAHQKMLDGDHDLALVAAHLRAFEESQWADAYWERVRPSNNKKDER